jgi:hypothetical protein
MKVAIHEQHWQGWHQQQKNIVNNVVIINFINKTYSKVHISSSIVHSHESVSQRNGKQIIFKLPFINEC